MVLKTGKEQITSGFAYSDPERQSFHKGVDIVKEWNQLDTIVAIEEGTVIGVRKNVTGFIRGSYGNYVDIKHAEGYVTTYAHLAYGQVYVNVGDHVAKGQDIGYMGDTGEAYGAHLHFEVLINNQNVDPTPYILGAKKIPTIAVSATPKLYLSASEPTWRVYPMNVAPTVGNECGFILPAKFGGLVYDVLGYTQQQVAIIQTRDFGRVQIYINDKSAEIR